jgi:hypothetical protein
VLISLVSGLTDISEGATGRTVVMSGPAQRGVEEAGRETLTPLYVAPRLDPALAKWLWKFSRNCTERHVDVAVRTLAPLGWVSRRLFDELLAAERRTRASNQRACSRRRILSAGGHGQSVPLRRGNGEASRGIWRNREPEWRRSVCRPWMVAFVASARIPVN